MTDVLAKGILLFGLNLLDALLTIIWVRNDLATEGNALMDYFLQHSEFSFLSVKIIVGTAALLVFYRWAHLKIAQIGVTFACGVYLLLMGIHLLTGIAAAAN